MTLHPMPHPMLRPMLLALVVLAGCDDESSPLTPNQYFQQRAAATCAAVVSACLVPEATCISNRVAEYTAEYQSALASGRSFIPGNAEACLAKVKDAYGKVAGGAMAMKVAEHSTMQEVCANVYRGSGVANAYCQVDVECIGELVCDKNHCGTPKPVSLGAGCANIGEMCPPGAFCSGGSGVRICSAKIGLQGDCTASPCMETLRCFDGICVAQLGIGETCTMDGDCGSGFCEPYAGKCAADLRFANRSAACVAMGGSN
jgi:hypothetical protein